MTRSTMVLGLATVALLACGPAHAAPTPAGGTGAPPATHMEHGGDTPSEDPGAGLIDEVNDLECTVGLAASCPADGAEDDGTA
ncbi:hypothetical protein GQF42_03765 [Streptomyces broussonetiae]|uniref:Secreted protein n=1 Tax=Streptomyces broussonetiae TaxID=2686304 RepID=A0A6I6N2S6_9ACTN|nr:hypothetical protein [Streptomyces broussonetiae]QHA02526.1 hypothetical protein GQF42_03765 [Streptomyces broussonetiae]